MTKTVIEYDFTKHRPALDEVWQDPLQTPPPRSPTDRVDGFWLLLIGGVSGAVAVSIIAYGLMRFVCS